ncbi:MAG: hypothetical protein NVS2B6_17770 [Thermoleophilaceae bacterium]
MRRLRIALLMVVIALVVAPPASATRVLVLHGRHVSAREDRALPATDLPTVGGGADRTFERRAVRHAKRPPATPAALAALLASGGIDRTAYDLRIASYDAAVRAARRLRGTRQSELAAVIANVEMMAASGSLTPDRLAPIFMTLDRNVQWWTTGSIPAAHERIGFDGSQLVWEYYPGQGIELQMLGNFGKANGLWGAGASTELRGLLAELVPLAAIRGGAPAWEYYFRFDGGAPPWTSSISQGTAEQALARASKSLGDPALRDIGARALGIFAQPPPLGVRVQTAAGNHYLIYSFAPTTFVLNAFLQADIGLYDFASITGDPTAAALFAAGDAEARVAVPGFDTGAWSLYQPGIESDLSYHTLVTGFLSALCKRTSAAVYCDTAKRFNLYKTSAPAVAPLSTTVHARAPGLLGVTVNKVSRVRINVLRGGTSVFSTSALLGRGPHYLRWTNPPSPGSYALSISATDLAGNSARATGTLRVGPPKRKAARRRGAHRKRPPIAPRR